MFPDRPILTPSWDLPVEPGNVNLTENFNGTIQHAMQQMNEAHPGWLKEYEDWVKTQPAKRQSACIYPQWANGIACGGFSPGRWDANGDAVKYLHNLPGMSGMRAGPKACGRVSCSYDTAVFTCNDVSQMTNVHDYVQPLTNIEQPLH